MVLTVARIQAQTVTATATEISTPAVGSGAEAARSFHHASGSRSSANRKTPAKMANAGPTRLEVAPATSNSRGDMVKRSSPWPASKDGEETVDDRSQSV